MSDLAHYAPLISALVSVCNFLGLIILGIYARAAASRKAVAELNLRLLQLETLAPGRNEMNELKGQLHAINGDMKSLSARIEGLSGSLGAKVEGLSNLMSAHARTMDTIEQHLLNAK